MKKQTIYSIIGILLLTIVVVGSTYAAFMATVSGPNEIETQASKLEVIYTGDDTEFNSPMNIASKKEEGQKRTVNISVTSDSVQAKATIYINIEEITNTLAIKGFVWEVYGVQDGKDVYYDKGNFEGYNDTTNNIVNIVEDYKLTDKNTAFTIYLWIDGNQVDNNVIGSTFKGHIGAKTENITGEFK